jgi:predicted phosphoribosyltransferase
MSNYQRFPNRVIAGQQLAQKLQTYQNCANGLVLALPRGGVPVAFPIAQSLDFPLDLCLVRKLGAPERPELAMGAIAGGNIQVMNPDIIHWLGITAAQIAGIVEQEQQELERRTHCYRGQKPFPNLSDRTIILVDDGIATGATMQAAIAAIQSQNPRTLIVAVPVVAPAIYHLLQTLVDEVVCLIQPDPLHSISLWYENFQQVEDEEVQRYLAQANPLPLRS